MAWSLASRPFRRAAEGASIAAEVPGLPVGVVALGRGGAGEIGALLREDGVYAGLLSLMAPAGRGLADVAALAETLPTGACQIITTRWPIDSERAGRSWRVPTRSGLAGAALAGEIGAQYLPTLSEAGWSEVRTFLAIVRSDPDRLLHDLLTMAEILSLPARPATLAEVKRLAGEWYAPHAAGLVTIGWALTELIAEPRPDWPRAILEAPALRGVPTVLTLHLEAAGAPAPVSLEVHRRLADLDAEIAARRRFASAPDEEGDQAEDLLAERHELLAALASSGTGSDRPRPAQLLLACSVEPQGARALRGEVEAVLHRAGLLAISLGPGRSDDTLLSCAPLGIALVGRELTLTTRGAALLAPIAPAMDGIAAPQSARADGVPLGLRRDGAAALIPHGSDLVAVGAAADGLTAALQTWALGRIATGTEVLVVDTHGGWRPVALAAGGERVQVALSLGALLGGLGAETLRGDGPPARQVSTWADTVARTLFDLCPDLGDDELGDLTGHLLALAEGDLAWGEPVQLGPIVARLRENEHEPARHLAAMLTATGALRPAPPGDWVGGLTIFDAVPDDAGQRLVPPSGCAAVALGAIRDTLSAAANGGRRARLVILDDLAVLLEASAGPALLAEILHRARQTGVAVWCAATSLAACPRPALEALRALRPLTVLFPAAPEGLRLTARALDLPPGLFEGRAGLGAGEALVVRGEEVTPIQLLPLALPPYTLR